jgi:CubicO group peptidase (beta-lactamase class C family)
VTTGGLSSNRLARVRYVLERHVDAGYVPGAVAVVARHDEVHIEAMGNLAFEGAGSRTPIAADTICRIGSMTKPVVAACAMTLVEDCTLRLDDPVDEFLPELAEMTVLADPNGPLDDTVPAERPITLRDLLTFTLGTGMVPAEPGTVPISDTLNALHGDEPGLPPDAWIRRLGALPLVCQPGERWMYHTAADVTGVLIARATGMPFGDALRERICAPLGMKDTAFSVPGESISRLSTAYQRDDATSELVVEDGPDGYWSRPPAFESGGGGARLDRPRFPRLHLSPARRRYPSQRAGALAAIGDADDQRPPDAGAEGGFRVHAGLLRRHRLGFRDVGPHPPPALRACTGRVVSLGRLGRELRMARRIRHRLVQRPGRGHDDNPHDPTGPRTTIATDLARLLDSRLPGDRRLTPPVPTASTTVRRPKVAVSFAPAEPFRVNRPALTMARDPAQQLLPAVQVVLPGDACETCRW